MREFFLLRFQLVRSFLPLISFLFLSLYCQNLWALQDALVTADQAVIYSDLKMSAPVGFVSKGKKVRVGSIARNHAQLYPIVVKGKVGYIRVIDVSTARENTHSNVLTSERFKDVTKDKHKTSYAVSFFNYSSQVNLNIANDQLKDKDPVNWYGLAVNGAAMMSKKWDLNILFNLMTAQAHEEVFRVVEFGVGASAKIIDESRLKLRFLVQALSVPFASYAFKEDFRVNGYGYSLGTGLNLAFRLGRRWGMETYGGFYFTKISKFAPPSPYNEISPSFLGTRLGVGVNYEF